MRFTIGHRRQPPQPIAVNDPFLGDMSLEELDAEEARCDGLIDEAYRRKSAITVARSYLKNPLLRREP